jgi:hypothetical protein
MKPDYYNKFIEAMDLKYNQPMPIIEESRETSTELLLRLEHEFKTKYSSVNIHGIQTKGPRQNSSVDPNEYMEDKLLILNHYNKKVQEGVNCHVLLESLNALQERMNGIVSLHEKEKVFIEEKIESINDLLKIIDKYPITETIEYNIDMMALNKIKPGLLELNAMIGMKSLKENIVDQILYYLQGLHKNNSIDKNTLNPFSNTNSIDFLHTVIYGPPGTGKTEIAKIIGKIFSQLGVLKKGTFRKAVRSDLIAGFLGQTAIKTKDVIQDCLGGVLFIDEAYSLGNPEKRDSFSKECIDTLCEAMSDHKDELMVIIAGYEYELKECFFSLNQGLDSRFTWRFKTDEYKAPDLHQIFLKKVADFGWSVASEEIKVAWFEKNMGYFKYFGRDMETLFSKTKIAHSRRVFCLPENEKRIVSLKDLEKGFEIYLKNDEVKSRKENDDMQKRISSIYV